MRIPNLDTGNPAIFSNSNGVTFGTSGDVVTASVNAGGGGVAISAGTQLATSGSIVFSNSNNVTFGMSGSTQVTASASYSQSTGPSGIAVNALTTYTSGNIVFSNGNGVTFGTAGQTITASVAAAGGGVAISAGTQLATSGSIVFSNSNNVTFGMSGSTQVTASAGPAWSTFSDWEPNQLNATSYSVPAVSTIFFCPIPYSPGYVSLSAIEQIMSISTGTVSAASGNGGSNFTYGLYNETGPSGLALVSSSSIGFQAGILTATTAAGSSSMVAFWSIFNSVSTGVSSSTFLSSVGTGTLSSAWSNVWTALSGQKIISLPFAYTLNPQSSYAFAYARSTSSAGAPSFSTFVQISTLFNAPMTNASFGAIAVSGISSSASGIYHDPSGFAWSTTSNALPATIAYSDGRANSNLRPYLFFEG